MEGTIKRVSGPVASIIGLKDPKMNDIVRVGNAKLLGEIIKIEGQTSIVQVYEDTTGVRVGEPAENTERPLSVVLGPGLIGSIFDGTQRPLDKIKEKTGDFISRGVDIPPLDLKKKWAFKPSIESGADVKAGQAIGSVKETSLVDYKVMIPPGVAGKLVKINAGEFTINDAVAKVKTEDGEMVDILLSQTWPVRKSRPVSEKLPPQTPLITGQRVIDMLFPVAKGGTAAVPGPFGSGKCVAPETPVLDGNGELVQIKDMYDSAVKDGIVYNVGSDEFTALPEGLGLYSFYNNSIDKSSTKLLYKGKSSGLVKIKTRTGREVKVTPAHKLFKVSETGEIMETQAKDLKRGDFICSVRKLDIRNKDALIDPYEYLPPDVRTRDASVVQSCKNAVKRIRAEKIKTDLKQSVIDTISRTKNASLKLEWVKAIHDAFGTAPPVPHTFIGNRRSNEITLPSKVSAELAEFLGYYVSEGYIRGKNTVEFTNLDERLLNRFLQLSNALFSINGKKDYSRDRTPNVLLFSRVIADFIKAIGAGKTSHEKAVPGILLRSSNEALAAFLSAYYEGDGTFSQSTAEFCTASRKLHVQLSYILTRFGVIHTLSSKKVNGIEYYRVFISGLGNLRLLSEAVGNKSEKTKKLERYVNNTRQGPVAIDVVPVSSAAIKAAYERLSSYTELKKAGMEIHNYIAGGEKMSVPVFKRFVSALSVRNGNQFLLVDTKMHSLANALDYIYCDEIKVKEEEQGEFDVYDVVVPEHGSNFIGGNGGIVLHNTIIQHQLAKWSDADIIVYVGCGERGNEMTEILTTFPELKDPKSGRPLMERTVLIANTSNMPVAAREASIYTGVTIAEYYRDMGYDVALMADSTSRWAEALREISGRLEEMPGEQGYPAYLARKISEFYERAGRAKLLSGKLGSLTLIGAVSPPGGDISEPVSQNTLRATRVFWALDSSLANRRHFPAINWLNSYSLYEDSLMKWFDEKVDKDWSKNRVSTLNLLQKEAEITEVAQLVGYDALTEADKMVLDIAKSVREDILRQSAFDDIDTYSSMTKQAAMLSAVMALYEAENSAVNRGLSVDKLQSTQAKQLMAKFKFVEDDKIAAYAKTMSAAIKEIDQMKV